MQHEQNNEARKNTDTNSCPIIQLRIDTWWIGFINYYIYKTLKSGQLRECLKEKRLAC